MRPSPLHTTSSHCSAAYPSATRLVLEPHLSNFDEPHEPCAGLLQSASLHEQHACPSDALELLVESLGCQLGAFVPPVHPSHRQQALGLRREKGCMLWCA